MGRRLPYLLALSLSIYAQARHTLDVHVTVNMDAIARANIHLLSPKSTPRPKRIPTQRAIRPGGVRVAASSEAPSGATPYTGFPGLLDLYGPTPPDTGGAVGPHDVVTMLNSQVMIQARTGAVRPTYPIDLSQFWSGLGAFTKVFDPRILYDRANDRWIASAGANPSSPDALLLLGVSETGDPGGNWSQFEIPVGASGSWADYPVLGLNRNWIVLSANLFVLPPFGAYSRTEIYVFDKAALYQRGVATYSSFSDTQGQFTPAVDLDRQSDTLYFAQSFAGTDAGRIRVSLLKGPVGAETFIAGVEELPVGDTWAEAGASLGDFAPQRGIWYKVDTGDSRLQNCVFRNAAIWCTQTVFLPAESPARASVQWFQLDPSASRMVQFGRIDDPDSIVFYAFPSIAVNQTGDALIGYTRFSPNDYPSAAFSVRKAGDALSATRLSVVFKQGEAPYAGLGADEGANRWGDVSGTVVDPSDDLTFWTIQEYASTPTEHYLGRWGTWWATVPVSSEALNCTYSVTPFNQQFDSAGGKGTVTVTTSPGCPWMAASNTAWMTIASGSPAAGRGTVTFEVSPNATGQPLSGVVIIAGQTFTVTQNPSGLL